MEPSELTWDQLADIYKKQTGHTARILPMEKIFEWAENRKDLFAVTNEGGLVLVA